MQFKGTLKEKFKANRVPGIQAYNARSSFVKHPASSDARASSIAADKLSDRARARARARAKARARARAKASRSSF